MLIFVMWHLSYRKVQENLQRIGMFRNFLKICGFWEKIGFFSQHQLKVCLFFKKKKGEVLPNFFLVFKFDNEPSMDSYRAFMYLIKSIEGYAWRYFLVSSENKWWPSGWDLIIAYLCNIVWKNFLVCRFFNPQTETFCEHISILTWKFRSLGILW